MRRDDNNAFYDKLMAGTYDNTAYGDWTAAEKEMVLAALLYASENVGTGDGVTAKKI
jgi:hypothetical protein